MKVRALLRICAGCMLLLGGLAHAGSGVRASLDRDHVQLGDSVTLTLSASGPNAIAQPDLSPLQKDFRVLGRSTSVSQSWINGAVRSTSTLSIGLRPLHTGTLHIPVLDVGGQKTDPLVLHVSDAPAQGVGKAGDPVFFEASLSSPQAYVGQQVALDVKLYYSSAMMDGNTSTPQMDGAQVQPLGRADRFQTQRGNMSYRVIEWHYAVVPAKSGALELAPIQFSGHVLDTGNPNGFINSGRQVTAQSRTLKLRVLPRPQSSGTGPWLPARQLELSLSGLPASGQVQVGEPVTVTIHEGATGLSADALPEPTLPDIPGADVYPDQPQDVTRNNQEWLTGSRSRSFAIVPKRAGTLQLPEITLPWWDVTRDQPETARIPAQTLTVMPAAASTASAASTAAAATSARGGMPAAAASVPVPPASGGGPAMLSGRHPAPAASSSGTDPWRIIALAMLGLWVLTIAGSAAWWLRRRRGPPPVARSAEASGVRALRNAFLAAARGNDPNGAARALLRWARAERPEVRHLGAVAERLEDTAQVEAIGMLQRSQFGSGGDAREVCTRLAEAFRRGIAWRATPKGRIGGGDGNDPVPPLYPPHR